MNRNEFQKAAKLFRAGRLTLDEFTAQALEQPKTGPSPKDPTLSFYLFFEGQCSEAFDFYVRVFDAEEICRQTYADGPAEMFKNEPQDHIMHATLKLGDSLLMGSDHSENVEEQNSKCRENYAVSFRPTSKSEADRIFELLSQAGTIQFPLQDTFWGSYFGRCIDQFGVPWMLNCPTND